MCGIVGVVKPGGGIIMDDVVAMRDSLTHRGPDSSGSWVDSNGSVSLAHRRLSILDLTDAGHQPMVAEDRSAVLVFNGEIYNFGQLRKELEEKGYEFKSRTDTEVILHAYSEWGPGSVAKLNGMFAFALFDLDRRSLLLARDAFGEKPLFYSWSKGEFVFSSELRGLRAWPGYSSEIDREVVLPYLVFGYVPYPRSVLVGTSKLAPAHYMLLDVDTMEHEVTRYWDPSRIKSSELPGTMDEACAEVKGLLEDSVRLRRVADVPVGAFLSGGIDSSLIVSLLSNIHQGLKTFTIGFGDEEFDEAPRARAIARHLGCEHYEHYVTPKEAQDLLLELPEILDEPLADASAIPTTLVSRLAKEKVKVVLTGDGSDELFAGYTTYPLIEKLGWILNTPYPLRDMMGVMLKTIGSGSLRRHAALLRQGESWAFCLYLNERTVSKLPDALSILGTGSSADLCNSPFALAFEEAAKGRRWVEKSLYADMMSYLVDDNLAKIDRTSMSVSLEARAPFLDLRVVEFCLGLPIRAKLENHRKPKWILRKILSHYLPRDLIGDQKRGFSVPMASWLRGELRWLVDTYLDPKKLRCGEIFNPDVVKSMVAEHMGGHRDREAILWAIILWEIWRERRGI